MANNESSEKRGKLADFWKKTVDSGKKAADSVQKTVEVMVGQTKKSLQEQRMKKYNPLFPQSFQDENFKLPALIKIVDDVSRRDVDVCEGAIGWIDVVRESEVLYLYDEWVEKSEINFIPVAKLDAVYCRDQFDRSRYIDTDNLLGRANQEKRAELQNVAYSLGAKWCSIEIEDAHKSTKTWNVKVAGEHQTAGHLGRDKNHSDMMQSRQKGITLIELQGHSNPSAPTLKWFKHDDNILELIRMRCSDPTSVKNIQIEIEGESCSAISVNTAVTIDALKKFSAATSMESKVRDEISSKMIFEVQF